MDYFEFLTSSSNFALADIFHRGALIMSWGAGLKFDTKAGRGTSEKSVNFEDFR
jgi:hypothetical protein